MAHKKAAGSTSLGRESESKRLGVKLTDGQWVKTSSIIIRQRGTKYCPGLNVKKGKDDTLFSLINGFVKFSTKKVRKFNNSLKVCKIVSVLPPTAENKAPDQKIVAKKTPAKKGATMRTSVYKTTAKKNLARQKKFTQRNTRLAAKKK
ncbi:MAG: 50S ribosomal protein L27 [Patescibacteria group bacterium]|jgi:large subunit ribosomal protein L27